MQSHILDDDPLVRAVLVQMLAANGVGCHPFSTSEDFLAALDTLDFGCVLLDLNMPGQDGHAVLAEITRRRPTLPVVIVSGSAELDDAIRSFRSGAVHFLRKPFRRQDLLDAFDEAHAVGTAREQAHQRRLLAQSIHLTAREREILGALAGGEPSKTIAWRLGVSVRTVEMHRSNILLKLSARNTSQAVAMARELDLLAPTAAAA